MLPDYDPNMENAGPNPKNTWRCVYVPYFWAELDQDSVFTYEKEGFPYKYATARQLICIDVVGFYLHFLWRAR